MSVHLYFQCTMWIFIRYVCRSTLRVFMSSLLVTLHVFRFCALQAAHVFTFCALHSVHVSSGCTCFYVPCSPLCVCLYDQCALLCMCLYILCTLIPLWFFHTIQMQGGCLLFPLNASRWTQHDDAEAQDELAFRPSAGYPD